MSDRKSIPLTFALASSNPRRRCGTIEEIFEWLRNAEFVAIGLDAATVELGLVIADREPGPDLAHLPWLDIRKDPAVLRIRRGAQYVPVTADRRGDLMTRVRFEDKIDDDIPPGWSLADGSTPAIPNLTSNQAFFQGSAPNWTVYTVAFVGYGVQ